MLLSWPPPRGPPPTVLIALTALAGRRFLGDFSGGLRISVLEAGPTCSEDRKAAMDLPWGASYALLGSLGSSSLAPLGWSLLNREIHNPDPEAHLSALSAPNSFTLAFPPHIEL